MVYVKNKDLLLSHGNLTARQAAVDIIEYALAKADPYRAAKALITLEGDVLSVADLRFDLNCHKRIFLLGAGKATYPIAKALEDILDDRISGGVVVCKYGQPGRLAWAGLHFAGHPIPDESGFEASQKALDLAAQIRPGDIVFACITGGSSALFPLPVEGVTLEDKKTVNRLLLTCQHCRNQCRPKTPQPDQGRPSDQGYPPTGAPDQFNRFGCDRRPAGLHYRSDRSRYLHLG
jgi:glycerate 2-kinase